MAVFPGIRSGCLLFILGASVAIGPLTLDQAWAKSDRGAERSSDRGGGHKSSSSSDHSSRGNSDNAPGRSGGSGQPVYVQEGGDTGPGNGNGKANGHNKTTTTEVTSTEEGVEPEDEVAPNAHGKLRSQMGALNAAHANANALANAAPNSRVGLIAQYANYVNGTTGEGDAQAAADAIAAYDPTDKTPEEVEADVREILSQYYTEEEVDALLDGKTLPDDLEALSTDVADNPPEFDEEKALALLQAAANKDITDETGEVSQEIIDEVNGLLGVSFPEPEAEEPPAEETTATTEGDTTTTTQ